MTAGENSQRTGPTCGQQIYEAFVAFLSHFLCVPMAPIAYSPPASEATPPLIFAASTRLSWAARNGNESVVRVLVEQGDVNPNIGDRDGRTPLSWAAGNGHEGVVRILLERLDTNPNLADTQHGQTPRWFAAEDGDEGVMRLLLERDDVDPNIIDTQFGRTPLSLAVENGHEGVVRILPVFASGQSGQALGRPGPAWALLGAGRAGLWAAVRLQRLI